MEQDLIEVISNKLILNSPPPFLSLHIVLMKPMFAFFYMRSKFITYFWPFPKF